MKSVPCRSSLVNNVKLSHPSSLKANLNLSGVYVWWGTDDIIISAKLLQHFGCHDDWLPNACDHHSTFISCSIFGKLIYMYRCIVDFRKISDEFKVNVCQRPQFVCCSKHHSNEGFFSSSFLPHLPVTFFCLLEAKNGYRNMKIDSKEKVRMTKALVIPKPYPQ